MTLLVGQPLHRRRQVLDLEPAALLIEDHDDVRRLEAEQASSAAARSQLVIGAAGVAEDVEEPARSAATLGPLREAGGSPRRGGSVTA